MRKPRLLDLPLEERGLTPEQDRAIDRLVYLLLEQAKWMVMKEREQAQHKIEK